VARNSVDNIRTASLDRFRPRYKNKDQV
jgi:hypothetical protein